MFLEPTIASIRAAHRERCYAMEQRKRADLALLSFLRTQAGWRRDLPEAERKAIAERAKAFADGAEDEALAPWRSVVEASIGAREPFDAIEARALKQMEKLAEQLPVWEAFGEPIRGFGAASLAVIVGEAGDLSIYANPAKLWKRMGLAVMGDIRQGGLSKNAPKEEWIAHGYNRQRRSRMWNIGDALIKGNRDGEYRTLYLTRKEYETARNSEMTPMHAHRRAQRVMEKRLLKNLWQAWRQTSLHVSSNDAVSAAPNSEQQAIAHASPIADPPARRRRANHVMQPVSDAPGADQSPDMQARVEAAPNVQLPARRRAVLSPQPQRVAPAANSHTNRAE